MSTTMDRDNESDIKKQRSQLLIQAGLCIANENHAAACEHCQTFEGSIDFDHPAARELKSWHEEWFRETDPLKKEMAIINMRRGYFERQDSEQKFEEEYQKIYSRKYLGVCQDLGMKYGLIDKV